MADNERDQLIARYDKWKTKREKEHKEGSQKREVERERSRKKMLKVISDAGLLISNVSENGYFYRFPFCGRMVDICDQDSRIVGKHFLDHRNINRPLLKDQWLIEHDDPQLFNSINSFYDYKHICMNGPPSEALGQLLSDIRRE